MSIQGKQACLVFLLFSYAFLLQAQNISPVVTIESPTNGAVFPAPANFLVSASASDADGIITNVDFYLDSSLLGSVPIAPYTVAVTDLVPGAHNILAIATDDEGLKSTNSINIVVDAPPIITFSAPSPQKVAEGSDLTFDITVTDTEETTLEFDWALLKAPHPVHIDSAILRNGHGGTVTYHAAAGTAWNSPYSISFFANDGINPPVTNVMEIIVYQIPNPTILINPAATDFFRFQIGNITFTANNIVEASTNLIDWFPIGTNGVKSIFTGFFNPSTTPNCFYRVRTDPN